MLLIRCKFLLRVVKNPDRIREISVALFVVFLVIDMCVCEDASASS